jgi:hypothetical protein
MDPTATAVFNQNSKEQNQSWETNSCTAFQKAPSFFWVPIAVAARSMARTVFARSNIEIVGSNPT